MPEINKEYRKSQGPSLFRRLNSWLHLWLGLTSGVIVFIVCITGCIWVFQEEITIITRPHQFVETRKQDYAMPSQLLATANKFIYQTPADSANVIYAICYDKRSMAASVAFQHHTKGYTTLYLDPYSAALMDHMYFRGSFFETIMNGHLSLWLPYNVGNVLVNYGTLVFIILLITGFIWYIQLRWSGPNRRMRFTIKWKASWKRLNIDLHNVFGFYVLLVALILGVTGVVLGISWFREVYYTAITAGGDVDAESRHPYSDTLNLATVAFLPLNQRIDSLWLRIRDQYQGKGYLMIAPPFSRDEPLSIDFRQKMRINHDREERFFDQYTLKELEGEGPDHQRYEDLSIGEKLYRMSFDLHIGSIGGLPTKIIAFIASLISASLPITGFLIWYNRKFKKKLLIRRQPK